MNAKRKRIAFWAVVGALMAVAFALTVLWSDPTPPPSFVLATGDPSGAYHAYAQKLAAAIERRGGPKVELRTTKGSGENMQLLADGTADVAFVQGGVPSSLRGSMNLDALRAIARVYSEPLWVFHRKEIELEVLSDLRARRGEARGRIGVGARGSGTQIIALELLRANGVRDDSAELKELSAGEAVAAFDREELDVVFIVGGPDAEPVQKLLRHPQATLMSFFNHRAYATRLGYLRAVDVDQGLLSLEEDLPSSQIVLLSPSATLMTRNNVHPQVVELVTQAATEVFGGGNLLDLAGEFPSSTALEVPQHEAAHRYLTEGESWMARHVPFWALRWIERLKLLLIPLLAVLIPAMRLLPALMNWWIRRLIKLHYESLRDVETRMRAATTADELERELALSDRIEEEMKDLSKRIPGASLDALYNWRTHVNMVQSEALARLRELRGDDGVPSSPYGDLSFGRDDDAPAA